MLTSRDIYAYKAISQISRLLGNQDRNPFSPTYGCFHRDYWLDKTSDFPDAVRQFAVHALALVYKYDFPGNIYKNQDKILDWTIAGLNFWASIQHKDGSFDEFYPYERGWVGPTAFTTYTSIEAYKLVRNDMPKDVEERVLNAIQRAAKFIAGGESEEDHLANHHAMACLAVWKSYELLDDVELKYGFERLWQGFLSYHDSDEGYSREYDGIDPGYLSATVSFLGKIYQTKPDPYIFEVIRQSVEFCSYFVYPNGFYAGSLGSRNTLHFYPHGFEILGKKLPLAASIAEKMLCALSENKLVPPEIISDRYVVYRVPEYLLGYLDYCERPDKLPLLPYEQRESCTRYFPTSKIFVANRPRYYVITNLAKGGVVKVFNREDGRLLLNDCGIIGQLENGDVVTSQWIDPDYKYHTDDSSWEVKGYLNVVPSNKLFTPIKNIIFRSVLIVLGKIPTLSHWLKGWIRKTLILGQRSVPIQFRRYLHFDNNQLILSDEILIEGSVKFIKLAVGDEFFVRYVPQSRYFQSQEFNAEGYTLRPEMLHSLNTKRVAKLERVLKNRSTTVSFKFNNNSNSNLMPEGVYDIEYYSGRQKKLQLVYRLKRRTEEVETALRQHGDRYLQTIVDVGTADGLMLDNLRQRFGTSTFIGLDYSFSLLQATSLNGIYKSQADAMELPIKSGKVDAVIATAIIEHVSDPDMVMHECSRILRTGGLLVLTTPDPVMERIASIIGLLKETGHQSTFNLKQLSAFAEANDLEVVESRKFMFSPIGFPAEKTIEKLLGPLGLNLVMANQLLVAKRK